MGLTTTTNGGVGEERDDDQTKWDAGDGTSTTTRNNHQMVKRRWGRVIDRVFNLTVKKSKWEREGERVGDPAPIAKITFNRRWRLGRTRRAIMAGRASEVREDGEDGEGGGGRSATKPPPSSKPGRPSQGETIEAGDREKRQSADDGGCRDRRAGAGGCGGRRRVRLPTEARGGEEEAREAGRINGASGRGDRGNRRISADDDDVPPPPNPTSLRGEGRRGGVR
jgi:hypothetical protein